MKTLQKKCDNLSISSFIQFYNTFKGYKSEKREIIKNEYVDKTFTYSVRFTYTIVSDSIFTKGDTATIVVEDPIIFNTLNEAELYVKEALWPVYNIINIAHNNKKIKFRGFVNLKDSEIIYKNSGKWPEYLLYENGTIVFGLYDSSLCDYPSLKEFLYNIRLKYKYSFSTTTIVNSYDVNELVSIEEKDNINEDISKLNSGRNAIIVKEIKRTEQYLKFLKTLLK